jgi:flagellar hook-associated protein 3 FlgL
MSTRISTSQLYDRSIQAVLRNQGNLSDIQQQLSSGKKLLRPSDDPVGAAQVIRLTEELAQISQYNKNGNLLRNSLEQEEAVLRNINDATNRARVLMVQSGDGILNSGDRKAIGIEMGQIRDEIFDLMNNQNANGEYIFSGYQSQSPAFSYDASAAGNKYTFEGDDGINELQVSNNVRLQANSNGSEVFADVFARFTSSITATAGVSSASLKVDQQSAYDLFFNSNYDAVTPANNDLRVTILAGNQVQIDNIGTATTLATQGFTSGQPFIFKGLQFNISGGVGDTVDFKLDPPQKKSLVETLNDFYLALSNENISEGNYQTALSNALVGVDNGLVAVANATSAIGGRLNVANSVYESNLDMEITNKSARSNIEDVDYAVAVSELSKQETALQAAQATFSKVTGLSLFDYI